MNRLLIPATIGAVALAGGVMYFGAADQVTLTDPQRVVWDKPTTDAEWAEDVKAENFDIKSTGVLETMIESHTAKLAREKKAFEKISACPDCNYWEAREALAGYEMPEAELHAEATK